ncbi:citrate synthase [Novosphingobium fluoreni]|uniref:citrate synthase (unknown stereospecificity) n=1 Tax=Novosphingobium fluoreni TaxID=1391222 RepID=A0A7W6C458_9SPHN|nr:citrate synthase [Novosphingobium fluoreni]
MASSAMSWGEPSLETAISTVHQGRLIYRGSDATLLARSATWEDAAESLWQAGRMVSLTFSPDGANEQPFAALAALIQESYPGLGRSPGRLFADGEAAISRLAEAFGAAPIEGALDRRLARGWSLDGDFAEALRCALVLLADHELNASTFSVRVAASTGAPVAACLLAGLSALTGPRHGGAGAAALALLDEAQRRGPCIAVRQTLAAQRHLPGFGHPLYPMGDPRAAALFEILPKFGLADDLRAEVEEVSGLRPNIDFALAVLTRLGHLPDDASFRLFALGRSIGWVAHAIEQFGQDKLIRPRAQYTGNLPD